MTTVVRSIATANPPMYVTQREVFDCYDALFDLAPEERDLYRRLLLEGPVRGRHIGMDDAREAADPDLDAAHDRFLRFGRRIAGEAASEALREAGVAADAVRAVVTNTCTGYLCPGMSSYLSEDLGLRRDVRVFDLMGMGCGGLVPNWQCAIGALAQGGPVLSVAFEICTATLVMGNAPDLVVSNSIFGDGAAASVLDRDAEGGILRVLDTESGIAPEHREALRYRWEGGRLRNTLSRTVPVIGARQVHAVAMRLLERHGLDVGDIRHWAAHAGGTVVLDRVAKTFGLKPDALATSREVFCRYGNMSSPSVLFCLDEVLRRERPASGALGLMLTFGAGFTAFAALVAFGT